MLVQETCSWCTVSAHDVRWHAAEAIGYADAGHSDQLKALDDGHEIDGYDERQSPAYVVLIQAHFCFAVRYDTG